MPRLRLEKPSFRLFGVLETISGLLLVSFATTRSSLVAYGALFGRSGVDSVSGVMLDSEVQKIVPPDKLGRVSSIISLSYVAGSLLGIGLSGQVGGSGAVRAGAGAGGWRSTIAFVITALATSAIGILAVWVYRAKDRAPKGVC